MIDVTRRWLRQNRRKFAIGAGVLGLGYVAGQYVLGRISEARERMANERMARENLRRRFQQNQEDCTFTVLALLPTVTDDVLEALQVEKITQELQNQKAERLGRVTTSSSEVTPSEFSSASPSVAGDDGRSMTGSFQTGSFLHTSQMEGSTGEPEKGRQRKTKAQLWNELKITSLVRSFTLIYTVALLTLLTRIQLNLLGRRSYLHSVISLASPRRQDSSISLEDHDALATSGLNGADFENNRKFLTFSWWLLHRGWKEIMDKVETAVKEVFGPLNPREDVTFERLSRLMLEVRMKVEGATPEERK